MLSGLVLPKSYDGLKPQLRNCTTTFEKGLLTFILHVKSIFSPVHAGMSIHHSFP